MVSELFEDAAGRGLSDITTGMYASIGQELERGGKLIRDNVDEVIRNNILFASRRVTQIDEQYFIDALKDAHIRGLTTGARNLFVSIDDKLITSLYSRITQSGYTYAESIWYASMDYQDQMRQVIQLGLSQGRDFIKIAGDLNVYTKDGKLKLFKRIGKLQRGTQEFKKRIRTQVDYRSLRILRSELYASLQDASKLSGYYNPGCNGLYDWYKTIAEDFDCPCPEYEAGSPYELNNVPSYPHPNCSCIVRPRLRDRKEFVNDLVSWKNGAQIDYLNNWSNLIAA
jgi:hypothetical protein